MEELALNPLYLVHLRLNHNLPLVEMVVKSFYIAGNLKFIDIIITKLFSANHRSMWTPRREHCRHRLLDKNTSADKVKITRLCIVKLHHRRNVRRTFTVRNVWIKMPNIDNSEPIIKRVNITQVSSEADWSSCSTAKSTSLTSRFSVAPRLRLSTLIL